MAFLPRTQPYNFTNTGDTNTGLFEDVNTRSLQTVKLGFSAGKTSSGIANTILGYESGKEMGNTNYTTCIGFQAGANNDTVQFSTFVGALSGNKNINGSELVYIGYASGQNSKYAKQCVGVGAFTLYESETSLGVTAIGYRAGEKILDASYNTIVGAEAGQDNRSGNYNTMVGYQCGRSTFIGNYNTYTGVGAGYSNINGNANSFFGYKSGEKLIGGDLNVAIGAYSFQNISYASSNIVIGPYAYSGSTNNTNAANNVIIGTNVAKNAKNVSGSVILGTNAADTLSGNDTIVLGYNTGIGCYESHCNIFIGKEATSYTCNISYGIAIGSSNTKTANNSISIGADIVNRKDYCVSLGYTIRSDAKNSVIFGNNINITSVTNFKDPLYYPLKSSVEADAFNKLGMCNLSYSPDKNSIFVNPITSEIYGYANFGLLTSNSYVSPYTIASNFSLLDAVNHYAIRYGNVYNITNDNFNSNISYQPNILTNTSFYSENISSKLNTFYFINTVPLNTVLSINSYIDLYTLGNSFETDCYFLKNVATPYITNYTSNIICTNEYGNNIFDLNISYGENGGLLNIDCNIDYYITNLPKYGIITSNSIYKTFPEYMFAQSDSFDIVSYYGINNNSEYLSTTNSQKTVNI
ncbi:MAG: hypothetical protein EBU66_15825, partial [Bacteroidetes bacterium]|nr:hypothetical protein [Bacteroidota bacterium]